MAAIDLRRGLEHGGRGWGPERADATDGFDSEMQEWEDQLQDMQKKIEELYNEVQARRGGSDVTSDKQKNGDALAFGLGHAGHSGCYGGATGDHLVTAATAPERHGGNGFGCGRGRGPGGYGCAADHRNGGYGYGCHGNGVASEIGDLLQDYLGQGKDMRRKNNGVRRVHFNDTIAVSRDLPKHQDDGGSRAGNGRNCHSQPSGSVEETENHKNRTSRTKDKENTGAKPPLRQRDPSPSSAAPRPAPQPHPPAGGAHCDSPALDRKPFGQGQLAADRKCGSPSVLRKFGAMLHENEGKTLTEGGVVTRRDACPESPKASTPGCRRRARAPAADALTPEPEPGQRRGAPVAGSPKPRPRADSGTERDAVGGRRGGCAPSRYGEQPRADFKAPGGGGGGGGGQRNQRGQGAQGAQGEGPSGGRGRDVDALMELLDMLDIQHEYSAAGPRGGHAAHRQGPPQVNPAESSTATHTNNFSRPARPANQRPPSRWASRTPSAKITAPSGPMYRPPSPLARPASPLTRSPSPAPKHKSPICYSRQIETVIM